MSSLKNPRKAIPAGLLLLAIIVFGMAITHDGWSNEPEYREVLVKRGNLTSRLLTTGRVQPENRIDIEAGIDGRVEKVLVKEGDRVEKGQVLLLISSSQRAAIMDAARFVSAKEHAHWEKTNPPTQLVAPVSGTVIQRVLEPGQNFGAATAILVLANRFVIEAPVDETDLGRIRDGQAATVVLDAYPTEEIPAKVLQVSFDAKEVEKVTTYMMKVTMDKVPDTTRVGMTANVSFKMEAKQGVFLIPSEALKATENEFYVYTGPGGGEKPERRTIRTGLSDGTMTEVTAGLSEGDLIYIPLQKTKTEEPKKKGVFTL